MAIKIVRRKFIAGLVSAAVWPLAVRAQQPAKPPTIGFLGATTPSVQSQWTAAFVQRLRELGWIEGRNVAIEYRWAEGRSERFAEIAAEFVRLKVNVIVTSGRRNSRSKAGDIGHPDRLSRTAGDPVGAGFVASLARPGGNVTGLSIKPPILLASDWNSCARLFPVSRRLAIMANVGDPAAVLEMGEVRAAARTLGLEVVALEIRRAEDIAPAFETLKGRADALYVVADPLINTNRIRINTLALSARLPTMHGFREFVEAGGLMSYGPNFPDLFRRAADLRRQDSARGEAGRHPGRAADQVRARHQSHDCQGARPRNPGIIPRARRRGDRIVLSQCSNFRCRRYETGQPRCFSALAGCRLFPH